MQHQQPYWTDKSKQIAESCWIPSKKTSNQTSIHLNLDITQWNGNGKEKQLSIQLNKELSPANIIKPTKKRKGTRTKYSYHQILLLFLEKLEFIQINFK